ncbi:MAG: SUMF1/EgtB/PvdO family nonheme iron enzyme [Saprospiraceae bacterium]|nr:SUMF1/EgtB/PvdO family nonheme iron enzyme [Saprospiraceae bacterium]
MDQLPKIFIAYARKDAELLEELRIHLRPLERTKRAVIWYDGKIEPGAVWEVAIRQNLHAADIILLLLSAHAIDSDYFYEKEMTDALERHEKGEAKVVPLIIKPCTWRATPLAKLQALPKDGKPVSSWNDRDDAWNDAVEALLNIIEVREEQARLERHAVEVERQRKATEAQKQKEEARLKTVAEALRKQREANAAAKRKREADEEAERQRRLALDPFHDLMLPIQGGSFKLGGTHPVTLKDFHLSKHPVTQAQWRAIMGSDPSHFKGDDLPVEKVNWDEVQDFVKKLNAKTGLNYRLPSEAEWEYAAIGGRESRKFRYAGSNKIKEVGWYTVNSNNRTQPVMHLKSNELGLYDMSGNVWEWCQDDWHENFLDAPTDGKPWTQNGDKSQKVVRGGGWGNASYLCEVTARGRFDLKEQSKYVGFRLAL